LDREITFYIGAEKYKVVKELIKWIPEGERKCGKLHKRIEE